MSNSRISRIIGVVGALILVALLVVWCRDKKTPDSSSGEPDAKPGEKKLEKRSKPTHASLLWFGQRGVKGRRVAGQVTLNGSPVGDAEVRISSLLSRGGIAEIVSARTSPNGRFDLGTWPAERYMVTASRPDLVAAVAKIDLRDPMLKPPPDQLELRLSECRAVVTGTVLDASGGPIVGATVLRDATVGVTTADDGTYRLCLAPGENVVYFAASGYGGVVLTLAGSGAIERDVRLVPEVTIRGKVVREGTGAPQADAVVSAWTRDWASDRFAESFALSSSDGTFELVGLAPGRYVVYAAVDTWKGATEVVTEPGVPVDDATITLRAYARVAGRVVSGDKPVSGARVLATAQAPLRLSQDAISQPDGSFVLEEVPLGPVKLTATPYLVTEPESLEITGSMNDLVIEVEKMAAISGVVRRGGTPAEGIEVRAGRFKAQSRADGSYRLEGLAAGSYKLRATALDAYSDLVAVSVKRAEERTGVDIELSHAAAITGTVVDQDGHGVSDLWVRWTSNESVCDARTGPDGTYRCEALQVGTYAATVRAVPRGPVLTPAQAPFETVSLPKGDSVVESVLAVRLERQSISGTVVDGDGAPIPDARVRAQPMAGVVPAFYTWVTTLPSATSTSDGEWTLSKLAGGTYAIEGLAADGAQGVVGGVEAGSTDVRVVVNRAGSIAGRLVGYTARPVVLAQLVTRSTKDHRGMLDGDRFTIGGLKPGRYAVTAQVDGVGDVRQVDVVAGQVSEVEMVARDRGTLDVTVRDIESDAPVAGMACLATAADDEVPGVTSWDASTSPTTDETGVATLRAPVGPVATICVSQRAPDYSQARATTEVPSSGSGSVVAWVAKRKTPRPNADAGMRFDWRYVPPRVLEVRAGGPAEKAQIRIGDNIVAVDGRSMEGVSASAFHVMIANRPIGDEVELRVQRGGTSDQTVVKIILDGGPDR